MGPDRSEGQFFKAGYLEAKVINKKSQVDVKLENFNLHTMDRHIFYINWT